MDKTEYLKFSCENKGKCCNIYHLNKFKYNIKNKNDKKINLENQKKNKNRNKIVTLDSSNKDELSLTFD